MGLLENFQTKVSDAMGQSADWWNDLKTFTGKASDEADKRFPDQARDSSQKNAFRHALGAGRLAQLMGADSGIPGLSQGAQLAAKLAGYGWEAPGENNWGSEDSRHDLNANSFGIGQASSNPGFDALANTLESFARKASNEQAPQPFVQGKPYLTYTK